MWSAYDTDRILVLTFGFQAPPRRGLRARSDRAEPGGRHVIPGEGDGKGLGLGSGGARGGGRGRTRARPRRLTRFPAAGAPRRPAGAERVGL